MNVALAADIRIAAGAIFRAEFAKGWIVPGLRLGTYFLPQLVGPSKRQSFSTPAT
jgi:enoyl-CoA hydratase/carnithine racemase